MGLNTRLDPSRVGDARTAARRSRPRAQAASQCWHLPPASAVRSIRCWAGWCVSQGPDRGQRLAAGEPGANPIGRGEGMAGAPGRRHRCVAPAPCPGAQLRRATRPLQRWRTACGLGACCSATARTVADSRWRWQPHDRIELGASTLMLVPLVGPQFTWNVGLSERRRRLRRVDPGQAQHQGRRESQQDACGFSQPDRRGLCAAHAGHLAVLADGMGGMPQRPVGGRARRCSAFIAVYQTKTADESPCLQRCSARMEAANATVYEEARAAQWARSTAWAPRWLLPVVRGAGSCTG